MADVVRNGLAEFHEMRASASLDIHCLYGARFTRWMPPSCLQRASAAKHKGYRYRAGVAVIGPERDTLRVAVVVVNESNQQRWLPLSHCPVYANAVKARVTAGGRNWSSEVYEQRQHVVPHDSTGKPMLEACASSLLVMTFPPRASYTSVLKVPVREILGDSLPSGRYRVIARLMGNGGDGRKLDAGEVILRSL